MVVGKGGIFLGGGGRGGGRFGDRDNNGRGGDRGRYGDRNDCFGGDRDRFDSRGGNDAYHPGRDRNDDRGGRGRGDRNNHREREDRDPRISNYNNDDPNVDAFGRRIRVKEEDQGSREMKREASDRHSDRDHYDSK